MRFFLRSIAEVRPDEWRVLWMSLACNFLVLASYTIIRPVREAMGVAGGLENLPLMFTATLVVMLAANALFSALVANKPRREFIPIAYRFFALNLLLFLLAWKTFPPATHIWIGRIFFVWVSVFNLFVVSVFWALMADTFTTDQGKRLFGLISIGGTLGAILGAAVTASFVRQLGAFPLLLVSAALLEIGARCVRHFPAARTRAAETPVGGSAWSGIVHEFRSPYLLGISAYMLLYSITSTVLYFQQADIAKHHFASHDARTQFFAQLELLVNVLTVFAQIFVTGKLLRGLGVGLTLALPPLLSVLGFTALGVVPAVGLFVAFQTVRRAANYSISRPAREVLFTVLDREDKYKAKSFVDTFIYRTGDQLGAWFMPAVAWLGLGFAGISFVAAGLAIAWCAVSLWLGREQVALSTNESVAGSVLS